MKGSHCRSDCCQDSDDEVHIQKMWVGGLSAKISSLPFIRAYINAFCEDM